MDFSDPKTWTEGMRVMLTAPHIVFPLLGIALIGGWWFRGTLEQKKRDGLQSMIDGKGAQLEAKQAQIETLNGRIELARDQSAWMQERLALADKQIAALTSQIQSGQPSEAISATVSSTRSIFADVQQTGSALNHTLAPQSAVYSLQGQDVGLSVQRKGGGG